MVDNNIIALQSDKRTTYQEMYQRFCDSPGNVAVLADEKSMDYNMNRLACKSVKIDEALPSVQQSLAFKKGSAYTDIFKWRYAVILSGLVLDLDLTLTWP